MGSEYANVYMDISIDGVAEGRLVFELYGKEVPKTVRNFSALCLGRDGKSYHNTFFHRAIPGFMCQGGDYTRHDGTGGGSIYGPVFDDESFSGVAGKHTGRGCLAMANRGPNTNGSQFYICYGDASWLDGVHVVFGKLIDGWGTLDKMEAVGHVNAKLGNTKRIKVTGCGLLKE